MNRPCFAGFALFAVSALLAQTALAANTVSVRNVGTERAESAADLANAKGFANPLPAPDASAAPAERAPANLVPGIAPGSLFGVGSRSGSRSSVRAFGTFGIPYTTARVGLGSSNQNSGVGASFLSSTFPYRAIGKLVFTIGGSKAWCSASLIRLSVIVTAAHCIQNFGGGATIFADWKFKPGHWGASGAGDAQTKPYGAFNWAFLIRASSWANGTDTGSGAARNNDLALIILAPKNGQFVGEQTGYLGYGWNNYSFVSSTRTGDLAVAATSTLGYPALMDSAASSCSALTVPPT